MKHTVFLLSAYGVANARRPDDHSNARVKCVFVNGIWKTHSPQVHSDVQLFT